MERRRPLFVLLLCAAVWAVLLPARGVWAPDEARYAVVAREMKEAGRLLVPLLNGETYTQKPPLFFDLVQAASALAEGVPEWAVKVPSLLGGLLTLLFTALLAARLMGPRGAWLAPLLLGSLFKFGWQAQFGQIDMVLTALVTGQVALGLRVGAGQGNRRAGIAALALLAFLGVLAKGAVGCLLPWLVLGAWFLARRDLEGFRRTGLGWVAGWTLLFTALWLAVAGLQAGWDYPRALVLKQSVQRYLEPWHHHAPPHYYLGVLLADGLPFSLLLVPLAAPLLRKKSWREPGALLPLLWMAAYLVFFSLSSGKRSVYILPLYPGLALLLAYGFLNVDLGRWSRRGFVWAYAVLAGLFAALSAGAFWKIPEVYRNLLPFLVGGGLLLAAGASWAAWWTHRGRAVTGAAVLAGAALLFLPVAVAPSAAFLDRTKTPRTFAQAARPYLQAGGTLAVFPSLVPSVNYYTGTRTPVFGKDHRPSAEEYLRRREGRLLLVRAEDWGEAGPFPLLHEGPIGDSRYLLLASPGPPPSP